MYFPTTAIILSLVAASLAIPTHINQLKARQAITPESYADFQVSDGVAGNALAEVNAKFPIDTSNLANVSAQDLSTIQAERVVAENAEVGTGGFNDRIAAAEDDTEATALQNGKIKNKVLKLQLEVLGLQIQAAQGSGSQSKIDEEMTKLNTNVALDQKAAGQTSQGVTDTFTG